MLTLTAPGVFVFGMGYTSPRLYAGMALSIRRKCRTASSSPQSLPASSGFRFRGGCARQKSMSESRRLPSDSTIWAGPNSACGVNVDERAEQPVYDFVRCVVAHGESVARHTG